MTTAGDRSPGAEENGSGPENGIGNGTPGAPHVELHAADTGARLVTTGILSGTEIIHKVRRIALEILERHPAGTPLGIVGIETRGVPLARRIHAMVSADRPDTGFGRLDISLYRDDLDNLGTIPSLKESEIPFDVEGRHVILVDDVLFTGRTVRAAIGGIMDFGRPARIELAVLVDRGNRELPIQADYVGEPVRTGREEHIRVHLKEIDGEDAVFLLREDSRNR